MVARILLALTIASLSLAEANIGNNFTTIYTKYHTQPLTSTAAVAAGWGPASTDCVPGLGIAHTKGAKTDKKTPLTLYYSATGSLSAIGTDVYGNVEAKLFDKGYFKKVGDDHYHIAVALRAPDKICGQGSDNLPMGDRLIVAPYGANFSIPVTEAGAATAGFHKGSCFDGMGWHYFLDLETAPTMSWKAENLMPIVPMYNNDGDFHAFFFAIPERQQTLLQTNGWEPIYLFMPLMCKNTCDKDCDFKGTWGYSTMHMYFNDVKSNLVTCPRNLVECFPDGIGCCVGNSAEKITGFNDTNFGNGVVPASPTAGSTVVPATDASTSGGFHATPAAMAVALILALAV